MPRGRRKPKIGPEDKVVAVTVQDDETGMLVSQSIDAFAQAAVEVDEAVVAAQPQAGPDGALYDWTPVTDDPHVWSEDETPLGLVISVTRLSPGGNVAFSEVVKGDAPAARLRLAARVSA
ncbi:hypothetical protein [Methylocaldum sp.]|uniref:hypothetical protein n=1 Tax=Methylocaldum sp. TaxID=1969727 RepID=UPI002D2431C0|nr:hypothetical protein [Methylocaldum sp.]HYE38217.1 hypothetical protein [Methylocaldum sp.]